MQCRNNDDHRNDQWKEGANHIIYLGAEHKGSLKYEYTTACLKYKELFWLRRDMD
jgi:hypothetical protein